MSKFLVNGVRGASTHRVLEDCNLLSEAYHVEAQQLQKKYYPIEVDPNIPYEEKYVHMLDWFNSAHRLLVENGLKKHHLETAVNRAAVELRPGVPPFLSLLEKAEVPLLIFSAGLGDVLAEILRQKVGQLGRNVHVAANRMVFSETGDLTGFSPPCFHVFNKHAESLREEPYFTDVARRRHVVLLGDNLSDVGMAEGLDASTVLRVGFLNDRVDDRFAAYKCKFDVVIVGDGGFDFVNALLQDVL